MEKLPAGNGKIWLSGYTDNMSRLPASKQPSSRIHVEVQHTVPTTGLLQQAGSVRYSTVVALLLPSILCAAMLHAFDHHPVTRRTQTLADCIPKFTLSVKSEMTSSSVSISSTGCPRTACTFFTVWWGVQPGAQIAYSVITHQIEILNTQHSKVAPLST